MIQLNQNGLRNNGLKIKNKTLKTSLRQHSFSRRSGTTCSGSAHLFIIQVKNGPALIQRTLSHLALSIVQQMIPKVRSYGGPHGNIVIEGNRRGAKETT